MTPLKVNHRPEKDDLNLEMTSKMPDIKEFEKPIEIKAKAMIL